MTELSAKGKQYTIEDLALAGERAAALELQAFPDILPAAEASAAFEEGVKRLHRRFLHRLRVGRIGRRAAAIALALAVTLSAVLTANANAREAVLRLWKELAGESAVYWFEGEGSQETFGAYAPAWIPGGMEVSRTAQRGSFCSILYEGGGHMLVFEYSGSDISGAYEIFGAGVGRSVEINGLEGWLHEDNGRVNLIWADENNGIVFTISSDLDAETVLRAAAGVEETR